ncbi:S8 family serine peptidase [Arsukibacterium indicum]|uniref:S8 family serine peptidase n=1 Tax=Arsukibacterium indicum TaxID=2848612 RepID=A0ABS6MPS1_9GAMM|nr:S8 family serine peptidase [Arsukibacterium indicum]MBV2130778.1 S8 family serine peptidase [Arsukibacterium indicum]
MSKLTKPLALASCSLLALAVSSALAATDKISTDDNRYIIKYKNSSLGLSKQDDFVLSQHKQTKDAILARLADNGSKLKRQGARVHHLLAGQRAIAVELRPGMVNLLKTDPAIEMIEVDQRRYPLMQQIPYGFPMVQADLVSDEFAANQTVCVIDSGLDLPHEDFASGNISGTNDVGTGNWFDAGGPHGTHVAGTIGALNNDTGIVGIMPNGQLNMHIIKVFNAAGWGYSSTLASAVNACADAGATVVNMSLGGAAPSATESNAMQAAYDAGLLLIAAAGNDGNTAMSYPASYDSVVSVAAVDNTRTLADFSQRNAQVELAGPGVDVRSTYPEGQGLEGQLSVDSVFYDAIPMSGSGSGAVNAEFADCGLAVEACTDVTDKVCLISRGEVAFSQKVESCQAGGGLAAIIYNNESGNFSGTVEGTTATIPAVSISQEDGQMLMTQLGSTANLISGASNYGLMSGTSMASPHVAGVAALVWSHFPDCSNAQIRSALAATADDLGAAGRDTSYGFGLVQAKNAVDYLAEYGCSGSDDEPDEPTPPEATVLENGEAVTNLAGAGGEELLFSLDVPAMATGLSFVMSGGTGDADMYVKFGAAPTVGDYDCRPYLAGNNESCDIDPAQQGTYFVKVIGYTAFTDVSLTGSYTEADDPDLPDAGGETITNINIGRRSWQHYTLDVPAGMAQLSVTITGGRGDADLYLKYGSMPTAGSYDCRPNRNGNEESCVISNPEAGVWHMSVYGFRAVRDLTLISEYQP